MIIEKEHTLIIDEYDLIIPYRGIARIIDRFIWKDWNKSIRVSKHFRANSAQMVYVKTYDSAAWTGR